MKTVKVKFAIEVEIEAQVPDGAKVTPESAMQYASIADPADALFEQIEEIGHDATSLRAVGVREVAN